MSGGGPPGHHPHGRQVPPSNSAWNHLQVPNYFPRQPQHAHMSNEPAMLHQPTWHTPTPDPTSIVPPSMKSGLPPTTHHHQYQQQQHHHHHHKIGGSAGGSTQMTGGHPEWPQYHQQQRRPPIVDLSLTRNGSGQQNGEQQQQLPPAAPISLSVRDANRINSLPPGALEIQTAAPPMISVETPPPPPAQQQQVPVAPAAAGRAQTLSPKTLSPGLQDPKSKRAPGKRVDLILERLNPAVQAAVSVQNDAPPPMDGGGGGGILMTAASSSSHDENSNSSGILNVPTPNSNNDDVVSPYSNDDSLDGGGSGSKSRRKRKPSKTVRVAASMEDQEVAQHQTRASGSAAPAAAMEAAAAAAASAPLGNFEGAGSMKEQQQSDETTEETADKKVTKKVTERRRSDDAGGGVGEGSGQGQEEEEDEETPAAKTRRKASSEAETIDDIAAMVREGLREREGDGDSRVVSVIRGSTGNSRDGTAPTTPLKEASEIVAALSDTPVKSTEMNPTSTPQHQPPPKFVEVENKLEEMFAGIEDTSDPMKSSIDSDASKDAAPITSIEDELLKMEASTASSQQDVTSTSNDLATPLKKSPKKGKRKQQKRSLRKTNDASSSSFEPACANPSPNKKQKTAASAAAAASGVGGSGTNKKTPNKSAAAMTSKQQAGAAAKGSLKKGAAAGKLDSTRDVYAYDSGSNASSSRSRGPFIQIKGPRDSPLSVNVVNTPTNDDDPDHKRPHHHKAKKYHDDSEYRHKVRSKGLHCSTLSHQYDAQTKDASWICAFCKRGPHAIETTGPTHPGSVPGGAAAAPGDLFGPYLITTNSPAFERRLDDPFDKQFKSKKFARCLDAMAANVNQKITPNPKKKRKYSDTLRRTSESEDGVYLGITKTVAGPGESDTKYEIWAHEDCIVWSQGTYLVGPKIVGLEEAVWTSCNVTCAACQLKGANICCMRRGCMHGAVHVCCARLNGWQFDDANFKTLCPDHRTIEDDP